MPINRSKVVVSKRSPAARRSRDINTADPVKYFYDDQTTPHLHGNLHVESTPLPVAINGYVGGGQPVGSGSWQAASCAITIGRAVRYVVAKCKKHMGGWAGTHVLSVLPRAGKDLNAFYDRKSLQFFYAKDPVTGQIVFACESASVVSHELGHALLDIIRPDFWNTQYVEVWSFHEAFGDCIAVLTLLQHDEMAQAALTETGGDLTKSNVVTRLAKIMGLAAHHFDPSGGFNPNYLRNAANDFKYSRPESLPKDTPDHMLSGESHNFSRIWTGTWWEILAKLQKKFAMSTDPLSAFRQARDVAADYLFSATIDVPSTPRLFDALARQMLVVDQLAGSPHRDILIEVFERREILANKVTMLSDLSPEAISLLPGAKYTSHAGGKTVHIGKNTKVKLNDHVVQALSADEKPNPLYAVDIDMPMESVYHFDKDGSLIEFHETDESEAIEAAVYCVDYLHTKRLVSADPKTPFEIQNNTLVRSHICGCCGVSNSCDPNAPEYGKGYKGKNNAGCGCCRGDPVCNCNETATPSIPPKLGCITKVKTGGMTKHVRGGIASRKVC